MYKNGVFKTLLATTVLAFLFCNDDSGVVKPEHGLVTGRVLHPDNNLLVRIISLGGADSTQCNPATGEFVFERVPYGKCLVQVEADKYGLFETKVILDAPKYVCKDIVLALTPVQVSYLSPSNSQNLDARYFSQKEPIITDSGVLFAITFYDRMDTASVEAALTVLPDSVGVHTIWAIRQSLYLLFPYEKLAVTDTVRITVGRQAKDKWDDTLEHDFSIFYPVDTAFVRTSLLNKK